MEQGYMGVTDDDSNMDKWAAQAHASGLQCGDPYCHCATTKGDS